MLGLHEITRKSLLNSSYEEVFIPFLNQYFTYFHEPQTFYMFNWSGQIYPLCIKKKTSRNLFYELKKIKIKYPNNKIILIGCSHGGSVILGMVEYLKKDNINIDIVILLGTPISKENNNYASEKLSNESYIFTKIINIYSFSDYIQTIDIFFNNLKFCQRILQERDGIINYKINGVGHINLWHKLIWQNPFIIKIPRILSKLKIIIN